MTNPKSITLASVTERIILEKGGRASCKRVYFISNEGDRVLLLPQLPPFEAEFDHYPWKIYLEEGATSKVDINPIPGHLGMQKVSWQLRKHTLDPGEIYSFSLNWEFPHVVEGNEFFHSSSRKPPLLVGEEWSEP